MICSSGKSDILKFKPDALILIDYPGFNMRIAKFAKKLGTVLRRPAFIPTPPLAIRVLFGKMGVALTTESTKVIPERLIDSGYVFEHAELEPALRDSLGLWK